MVETDVAGAGAAAAFGVALPAVFAPFASLIAVRASTIFDPEMKWRMFEGPARVRTCFASPFTDLTLPHEPTAR